MVGVAMLPGAAMQSGRAGTTTFFGAKHSNHALWSRHRSSRLSSGRSRGRTVDCVNATPVSKNSLLVVGGTGTLGRQVVRKSLDEGYNVRCLVRPRQTPADFLRDWGATTVQGDLTDISSIPATLVGIHTVIDCATARPEESTQKIDWDSKVALVQCAQAMGIQRYIFFSIFDCDKHPEVPLMNAKSCMEKFIAESGLNYTIFRVCGFMQSVIGSYAIPILEDKAVWGTTDVTRTAYLDSQDVARMALSALTHSNTIGKTLVLSGPKAWSTQEVVELCEDLANTTAKVTTVPTWFLKLTRSVFRGMQWTGDAADRLAFAEVLSNNENWQAPMDQVLEMLDINSNSITTLDDYLKEYYTRITKKLKEVGASSKEQTDFYV